MSTKLVSLCIAGVLAAAFAPAAMAGTIADAKLAGTGTSVTLTNVVISCKTDMISSASSKCFQVQDATGGITIYGTNTIIDGLLGTLQEGDQVTVTGVTGMFRGLFQLVAPLSPSPMTKTGSPGVPTPDAVTPADFQPGSANGDFLGSRLVKMSNVQFLETGNFAYGNYHVTDGTYVAIVRIATSDINLVGTAIPTGCVNVAGIFYVYDAYELQPRSTADITPGSGPCPPLGPISTSKDALACGSTTVTVTLDVAAAPGNVGPIQTFVTALPAHGKLMDATDDYEILQEDLPYPIGGTDVKYQADAGYSGEDTIEFRGRDSSDPPAYGNLATIRLLVQGTSVVITEIMYNPANNDNNTEWEWIEIYNSGASTVTLGGFGNAFPAPDNLNSTPILPGQILIIARGANPDPAAVTHTEQQFLDEWGLSAAAVVFADYATWPTLSNSNPSRLYLTDSAGALLDAVWYGVASPWPANANGPSIYVKSGFTTTAANDDPGASPTYHWSRSIVGTDNARTSPGLDIGSPLYIPGVTVGNQAPFASSQTAWTTKGNSWDIYLQAYDDGLPNPPKQLDYVIDSLPLNGSLIDVDNAETPITTVPYTIPNQKRTVRFTASETVCGNTSFTFHASDTVLTSNTATITVWVECGDLIITEILYDPASSETTAKVTEWVEVYNTTDNPIDASGWYLANISGRSGDWPSGSIIPAHGVAVIVPAGSGTRLMDPTQFQTAWDGYTIPLIIQPSTGDGSNDAAAGEIVKSGLHNTPASSGEMLRIIDLSGKVQDVASYRNGAGSWPTATGESSIYLREGNYNADANDSGWNWGNSRNCAGGAYGSLISGFFDATDFGSPGFLSGVTAPTGNVPPTPSYLRFGALMNTPKTITLTACDDGNPVGGPVTFTITQLPTHGTLTDGTTSITAVPFTLSGADVIYTPTTGYTSSIGLDGLSTDDVFKFAANDGAKASRADGQVRLIVQKGGLVISEIMYDPAHVNADPTTGDSMWEWIEVTNTTASPITLYQLTDDRGEWDAKFLVNTSIPANSTRILAAGDSTTRTQTDFLTAWAPLSAGNVIFINAADWETLVNSGDRIQIWDGATGGLLDDVIYSDYSPWPEPNNGSSIYVKTGKLNALDNDLGENWALSAAGVDNAYASAGTVSDVGSPGLLPLPCTAPTVTSINPVDGTEGATLTGVSIVGTSFTTGATVKLTKSGQSDISATSVVVVDATHITCTLNLTGAAVGQWNVVVTTCDVGTLANGFTVNPACVAPTVTSVAPAQGKQGQSLTGVAVGGTNFAAGATVKLTKTGQTDIAATNVVVVDATHITCDVALPSGAATGLWSVMVTTCATGTLADAFEVKPPCNAPPQDADGDNDVDLGDFGVFQSCFNGPNRPYAAPTDPKCACVDKDKDADVDLSDFGAFQACFNGPNRPAVQPACNLANQL